MKTVRKVVITNEEWNTLNDVAALFDTWRQDASKEDYGAIEDMFESAGEKYEGLSYMNFIRNVLDEVCDSIDVED